MTPETQTTETVSHWYRVEADYGKGFVFVGEANDRTGYLMLSDRAYKDGAMRVRLYKCEQVF